MTSIAAAVSFCQPQLCRPWGRTTFHPCFPKHWRLGRTWFPWRDSFLEQIGNSWVSSLVFGPFGTHLRPPALSSSPRDHPCVHSAQEHWVSRYWELEDGGGIPGRGAGIPGAEWRLKVQTQRGKRSLGGQTNGLGRKELTPAQGCQGPQKYC